MRKTRPGRRLNWRDAFFGGALLLAIVGGFSLAEEKPKFDFGGDDRYLTHISTDKPIYRTGETLYMRSVLLHAFKHTPLKDNVYAHVKIKSPRGAPVMEANVQVTDSAGGASWVIPKNMAGGEYTISVNYPSKGYAPAERKFDIRAYRAPRLKTQLEFLKKAYGPGDKVSAALVAQRAEGGFPKDAKVTAVARIDGAEVFRGNATIDAKGRCSVSFDLPKEIKGGEGSLSLVIEDGGVIETASKTLPILLQKIPMTFCPEGGDLVAGLECGLYFEATTPWGDPADVSGEIVDAKGAKIADFATAHEGRGRVRFTPKPGELFAKILQPAGIKELIALPKVMSEGVSLRADGETFGAGESIAMYASATKAGNYRLALFSREKEVSSVKLELKGGETQVVFMTPASEVDGVVRATLFDGDNKPLAERLIFRECAQKLNVEIISNNKNCVPGEKVDLTIRTTNEKGEAVAAVVGLTVTDDSVLEMIEKRKQAPRLSVMALLENEVEHLEDARVYFGEDPKAKIGIDLLLGTQGWRRFAYVNPADFMTKHADKAKRAFAFREAVEMDDWDRPRAAGLGGGAGGAERAKHAEDAGGPDEPDNEDATNKKGGEPAPQPPEEKAASKHVGDDWEDESKDAKSEAEKPEDARLRRPNRRQAFVAVREYAHKLREGRKPGDRTDFTETLYWNAGVKTDAKGLANVSFFLNDSVTSFRVMADGYSASGALGQGDAMITSRQPFYIEPKLPLEVTAGDIIMLPVSLVNATNGEMKVILEAAGGEAISVPMNYAGLLNLKSDSRGRLLLPVQVGKANGMVTLSLAGKAGEFSDKVTREIAVRPLGFPQSYTSGGMLNKPQAITFEIPADVLVSSITTSVKVYPTPAANLTAALERLLTEPGG